MKYKYIYIALLCLFALFVIVDEAEGHETKPTLNTEILNLAIKVINAREGYSAASKARAAQIVQLYYAQSIAKSFEILAHIAAETNHIKNHD